MSIIESDLKTVLGIDTTAKEPIAIKPVVSDARKSIEALSTQIRSKVKVEIADINTFAKEAVAVISDKEGNTISPAQFGCIQIEPELKFFPVVGGE